jgi:phage recombination protein Bet
METSIMNAVVQHEETKLPAPVARRGITESQWRTLMNLFPGARGESVVLAWDYCTARRLDPFKKPCHIVPMNVKDVKLDKYVWRDVVMPGIYEYRTTAHRTGEYMGHSVPEYGPIVEYKGVKAPEWCSITVYRWNPKAQQRAEFPVRIEFHEIAVTKRDGNLNDRWSSAPKMQLTKCTEAAALREGFPDELGGTHTVEEMEGRVIDSTAIDVTDQSDRVDPRGDTSGVDWEMRDKHVSAITDLLAEYGSEEAIAAWKYRQYVETYLRPFHELWITVDDKLAADGIISKAVAKKYMKAEEPKP